MNDALRRSRRTLLVLTPNALNSRWVGEEWTAALKQERLVPVRVVAFDPTALLGTRAYINLAGLGEQVGGVGKTQLAVEHAYRHGNESHK